MFFSWTFDFLFIKSSIDIYCLEYISHHIKEMLYLSLFHIYEADSEADADAR